MKIDTVRDQDYLILRNERIVTVHGWNHPTGFAVGEVVFTPDNRGEHSFLGTRYRKAYQENGHGIPEGARGTIRSRSNTFYDDASLFAAKSIIDLRDVIAHVDVSKFPGEAESETENFLYLNSFLAASRTIIDDNLHSIKVGLTGSLRLNYISGNDEIKIHDVDLVYTGSIERIAQLVRNISEMARANPQVRLREHGKGWRIRIRTSSGILCPFFRYADPTKSPLHDLTMVNVINRQITVSGVIIDDLHNAYLPTYLTIVPTECSVSLPAETREQLPIAIMHLRSRGDFFRGDHGRFTGELVELVFSTHNTVALAVYDGTQSILLTPPWQPF